jgi:hypothetical protein
VKTSETSLHYNSGATDRVSKKTAIIVFGSLFAVVGVVIALIR